MNTDDMLRELAKARDALAAAEVHLARHAEANAALHCATSVMYSPLHARVTAAITGIDQAVRRAENGTDHAGLALVLVDLDRCKHGRHEDDVCASCPGGVSRGNPNMPPGSVVGYGLDGNPIIMPTRTDKHDPAAWRQPITSKEN